MPPKIKATREQIVNSAFEVVRTEGIDALTARRVARQVGCSTQPVYRAFTSMDELRAEVLERAVHVALSYMAPEGDPSTAFFQLGLGNLRFAQEEPMLYRAVTLEGPMIGDLLRDREPPPFVLERMRAAPPLAGLSDEQLSPSHGLMWFFSQGLANLFLIDAGDDEDPMAIAEEYLMRAGRAVVEFERNH
jgi:AcrR family transcriptional regulator